MKLQFKYICILIVTMFFISISCVNNKQSAVDKRKAKKTKIKNKRGATTCPTKTC